MHYDNRIIMNCDTTHYDASFGKGYKVVVNNVVVEIFSCNPSKSYICHPFERGMVVINQLNIKDFFLVFL